MHILKYFVDLNMSTVDSFVYVGSLIKLGKNFDVNKATKVLIVTFTLDFMKAITLKCALDYAICDINLYCS